jgi:AcrR family transcriptional regulator
MKKLDPHSTKGEERRARILSAALEVFSKSSFEEATTEDIARKARVSKRDLYASFSDKHTILTEVIKKVLANGEATFRQAIADSQRANLPLETTLEIIGLALVSELLSPIEGFVCRLALAESLSHSSIGKAYYDHWYGRRDKILGKVLTKYLSSKENAEHREVNELSRHFLALVIYLPQLTLTLGMSSKWNPRAVQNHVKSSVRFFLKQQFPL